MALKFTILASEESDRRQLEQALEASGRGVLAGRSLPLPQPFTVSDPQLRQLQAQMPEAVLIALPAKAGEAQAPEAAFSLIVWLRAQMPLTQVMVVGPMDAPHWIVAAMRSGAGEYLERPLRPAALEEALARAQSARAADTAAAPRGKLIAVMGARGGCGSTTVAVNLALALQSQQRQNDAPVVLLDAAPLGHAALHLNLKPHFTLADLLGNAARLDAALLSSLLVRHGSGLELLAGPDAPLPAADADTHARWIELLLRQFPLVIADLSARLDGLTRVLAENAERILFVAQTDMVSLWSAAKVRQYLDPAAQRPFELVLNRFTATPEVDLSGVESITHAPVLWKLPNAHALVVEAIERGEPPAANDKSDLARSFRELAALILGRPAKKRAWLPFFRVREAEV